MLELSEIPGKIAELEAEMKKLYKGSGVRQLGPDSFAFVDCGNIEQRWVEGEAYAQIIEILYEEQRRLTGLHDPNKCDTRKVRKELKDKLINLGMDVNKVESHG